MTNITRADAITDQMSCLMKAGHDEPVFILRAKDPLFIRTVRAWSTHARIFGVHEFEKVHDAERVIAAAYEWRQRNGLPEGE